MNKKDILIQVIKELGHATLKDIYKNLVIKVAITKSYFTKLIKECIDKKIIQELKLDGMESQFEIFVGPHDHFVCKECGKVLNINSKIIAPNMNVDGNICEDFRLIIYGKCRDCQERKIIN